MASKSKVCFFFEHTRFTLKNRKRLRIFIESLFKKEKKKLESINYIFFTDKRLLRINRKFLNHNFYTDVITFDLSESSFITAEIYISIDRVKENAKTLGSSFKKELHRVVFHGALHLCGYSDKAPSQQRRMRDREDFFLQLYFN